MSRLLALNKPEWPYGVVGFIAAIVSGCAQPAVSFLLAAFITVFYIRDMDELKRQVSGGAGGGSRALAQRHARQSMSPCCLVRE